MNVDEVWQTLGDVVASTDPEREEALHAELNRWERELAGLRQDLMQESLTPPERSELGRRLSELHSQIEALYHELPPLTLDEAAALQQLYLWADEADDYLSAQQAFLKAFRADPVQATQQDLAAALHAYMGHLLALELKAQLHQCPGIETAYLRMQALRERWQTRWQREPQPAWATSNPLAWATDNVLDQAAAHYQESVLDPLSLAVDYYQQLKGGDPASDRYREAQKLARDRVERVRRQDAGLEGPPASAPASASPAPTADRPA